MADPNMVLAVLWTGDTQAAIAGGPTKDDARTALIAANPGMTDRQIESIDYVDATMTAQATWSAILDGN